VCGGADSNTVQPAPHHLQVGSDFGETAELCSLETWCVCVFPCYIFLVIFFFSLKSLHWSLFPAEHWVLTSVLLLHSQHIRGSLQTQMTNILYLKLCVNFD
jgi:hypothetical protein